METCDVINSIRTFGLAPNAIYILGLCEITSILSYAFYKNFSVDLSPLFTNKQYYN